MYTVSYLKLHSENQVLQDAIRNSYTERNSLLSSIFWIVNLFRFGKLNKFKFRTNYNKLKYFAKCLFRSHFYLIQTGVESEIYII